MATVTVRVRVEIAGVTVRGFPLTVQIDSPSLQTADFVRRFTDAFAAFPGGSIESIALFLAKTLNVAVELRFGGQADAVGSERDSVPLSMGGIILVANGAMTTTPTIKRYDAADADSTPASVVGITGGVSADAE